MNEVAALHAKISELTETVDIQAEEILQLKAELVGISDEKFLLAASSFFKTTPKETQILQVFINKGHAPRERFHAALYGSSIDVPDVRIIDVFISFLRKKISPFEVKIHTNKNAGYSMSQEDRDKVKNLLGIDEVLNG